MKKTKIVATIGPASNSPEVLSALIAAGMNVARLNFSHGNHAEHLRVIELIRKLDTAGNIAILQDIAGPKIRIGDLEQEKVILENGSSFILTERDIVGNRQEVKVNHRNFTQSISEGDIILLNDGIIELKAETIKNKDVICRVINGGILTSKKGISLPDAGDTIKLLSQKDIEDIRFGISNKVDFIAVSFVRSGKDIKEVKKYVKESGIPIIAKIEKPQALKNFDDILAAADGIMIARGDLGVEIPFERVPIIQKKLIKAANLACKPVITATQMLASMVENLRPTRAEANDVANAIIDGTDAVMLSEETAIGKNPLLAVKTMSKLAEQVENSLNRIYNHYEIQKKEDPASDLYIAENACRLAHRAKVKNLVCFTMSGSTALKVSRFRPKVNIIALTQKKEICRRLSLSWGITSIRINPVNDLLTVIESARKQLTIMNNLKPACKFVLTCGIPFNETGNTNITGVF